MKRFIPGLGAVIFALGLIACSKASKEDCQKAADNLVNLTIEQQLKDHPKAQQALRKKAFASQAKKIKDDFVKDCEGEPADKVDCIINARSMDDIEKCRKK